MRHVGVFTSCYFNFLKHVGLNGYQYVTGAARQVKIDHWQEKIAEYKGKFVMIKGSHDGDFSHIEFDTEEDLLYFTLLFK
jgi:hypothetical protein